MGGPGMIGTRQPMMPVMIKMKPIIIKIVANMILLFLRIFLTQQAANYKLKQKI